MFEILTEFNNLSVIFRLMLSFLLGGIIGIDRERITRSAGFRTYTLVCVGSTLAMLIGCYIGTYVNQNQDISRIGAQVISGIGFLGAGAIINSGTNKVIGLTTAAALWTCACIGLAVGVGFYLGAIIVCFFTLFVLRVMKIVDRKTRSKEHFVDLYIELHDAKMINNLSHYFRDNTLKVVSLKSTKPKIRNSEIGVEVTILVNDTQNSWDIVDEISSLNIVSFIHKEYV